MATVGLNPATLNAGNFVIRLANRPNFAVTPTQITVAPPSVGGTQTVEPTVTNEEESRILGVPLHSPALLFERVTRTAEGDIVEFTSSIYRGDRYRLVSELGMGGQRALQLLPAGAVAGGGACRLVADQHEGAVLLDRGGGICAIREVARRGQRRACR